MKRMFLYFLLLLNAFFISYAYGLNSTRVKVIDHSLPPLKPPETAKAVKPAKQGNKADTTSSATSHTNKSHSQKPAAGSSANAKKGKHQKLEKGHAASKQPSHSD